MERIAKLLSVAVLATGVLWSVSPEASRSAREKIARIGAAGLAPGEAVVLTEDELNSYLRYDLAAFLPKGVRNPKVRLLRDTGVFRARIDLDRLPPPETEGLSGALWGLLLQGERDVQVTCRCTASKGMGLVEIESVEVDGVELPRTVVDWLVSHVSESSFLPGYRAGDPFPLPHNLRDIRLENRRAVAVSY